MLETCPLAATHGDIACLDGILWRNTYEESPPRVCIGPCGWIGHKTGGVTHCCEGDQACNDAL